MVLSWALQLWKAACAAVRARGWLSLSEGTGTAGAGNAAAVVKTRWVSQTLLLPVMYSASLTPPSQKRKIATLETSEAACQEFMQSSRNRILLKHFSQAETDVVPC